MIEEKDHTMVHEANKKCTLMHICQWWPMMKLFFLKKATTLLLELLQFDVSLTGTGQLPSFVQICTNDRRDSHLIVCYLLVVAY